MKSKASGTGSLSGDVESTSTKPSFAVGVDYALTPALKLRGEVESMRADGPAATGSYNVTTITAGLKFQF